MILIGTRAKHFSRLFGSEYFRPTRVRLAYRSTTCAVILPAFLALTQSSPCKPHHRSCIYASRTTPITILQMSQPIAPAPKVNANIQGTVHQVNLRDYLNVRVAPFLKKAIHESLDAE